MQLKKLELQGFKSFADKTEIVFLNGITTIVGPNGSGKSNVSDAVRWVLGEQSAKNLRGAKMEDVIFAGTQARKKVGFAEVSMYLDNSDESLPVEYKEVVVTRRVYRTGESNYLINGSECRLKDIQELFMDTGVGKDGYSIISQGKIDEILSSKSEERRHIFEEASGIVKYKTRKDEATRKLDNTQTTLNRVTDILNEIEINLTPLEEKCKVARKYLELKENLKVLDVKIFIESLNKSAQTLSSLDDIIETFLNDIKLEEGVSLELEKSKTTLKERLQEVALKIEETQSKFFETENESERLNSKINVVNATIDNSNENISRLTREVEEDTVKIELLKEEIIKREQKRESLSQNRIKFETDLALKQDELDNMMKTLDEQGEQITKIKDEIDDDTEKSYNMKMQSSSILATIESNEKQIEERKRFLDKNISASDLIISDKENIVSEINNKNKELNIISSQIDTISKELDENKKSLDEFNITESKLKQEIMTIKSKYSYLTNLDSENEGYYKSVKEALDYSDKHNISGVYGTVASIISTDEKYEYATEIALGGYLQNIVVDNEQKAKDIIEYLKQNSLGRVTFLPLNNIKKVSFDIKGKAQKFPGFIGIASELVKFDKMYYDVINLALGNTIIVDNVDNAIEMSKRLKSQAKIVTLTGELLATSGSITGGKTSHSSAGLIGRKEKIESLKNKLDIKSQEYDVFNKKIDEIKSIVQISIQQNDEKIKVKNDLQIEVATLNQKLEHIKSEEQKIVTSKENSRKFIEELTIQNDELKNKITENDTRILELDKKIVKNQDIIDEYTRFNKEKSEIINNLHEDIANLKVSISSFDESSQSIDEMKEKLQIDINNFDEGIKKKKNQIELFNTTILDSKLQIEKLNGDIRAKQDFKLNFANMLNSLKDTKKDIESKQEILEQKLEESQKRIENLKDEKAKVEAKKVKYDLEIDNLKNKMWDDYELTISSAKELLNSYPIVEDDNNSIAKNADKLRKEIKDLGDVNVGSIEEYKTTKERYDFITKQKLDLEETKAKLENLINNMTSIMKNQFSKQFALINENFNETFKELFGGGKAELKLDDEGDVLSCGIEIEVQPPGKKLQSMMLLSGGERALTATALLFAILKLKAPPFCILDEIEAALDDVNVHRFAEYIKKYSNNTQFIVITHRKGTMEVASSVYGVTMQEYGISKIISMKLK